MRGRGLARAAAALAGLAALAGVASATTDPVYQKGDVVRVFATHVGPVANPSETYPFYVLPYCPPKDGDLEAPSQAIGETFAGDRKMNTPYEFKFGQEENDVVLCERELTEEDVVRWRVRRERRPPVARPPGARARGRAARPRLAAAPAAGL
jgi:hypothetical protein